jgi:hypothetical protein
MLAKCSEILANIILGPMDSNGCFTTLVPRNIAYGPETLVSSFTCLGFAKCSETLPYIILGPMDLNGCITTLVPRNSAFGLEHKFCIFYVSKVSEMPWNTPKHHFGSNGYFTTLVPQNSAFRPKTQVLHPFTCWRLVELSETLANIILGPMD